MSPRWSLRASSPQLPKLGMELKINTMDGELIEVGSSEAARKVILLHGLTGRKLYRFETTIKARRSG